MKKYYELYNEIKEKIESGEYKAGEKLPSKRVISDKAGVSVITVETAYQMLLSEGYIISKERSGYYVNKIDFIGVSGKVSHNRLPSYLAETVENSEKTKPIYSFIKTARKVLSEYENELFYPSNFMGLEKLRNAISKYLSRYRNMFANPSNIIIGSGAEQLYETVVKILGREKTYGVENPCYEKIKSVITGEGAKIRLLDMGKDGIKSEELKKDFSVLHVTPFSSYPSMVTASIKKRHEYLKWAIEKNAFIVEDDFASEFFQPGHPIKSLYSLDENNLVIYINTFSKSISPSMRIGYMILPDSLLDIYKQKLGAYSCSVPVLDQLILAEFISSGEFERLLNKKRKLLQK